MSDKLEGKILSLFALGNSYAQIADHIEDMYGVHFLKPAVTDKLIPNLEEWKKRPLASIYLFMYLDAIHYKVREDGHYLKLLYAGIQNAERKWSMPIRNWSLTISQLNIHFKEV